jgi:uncharacterized flavoprotein (TIGR03862 family)
VNPRTAAVIGGGPAGLMAAEVLAGAGHPVDLFEAMPSVGRKLLFAGKSGLNLTHAEDRELFLRRYGARQPWIEPLLDDFSPEQLRAWVHALGVETFVGSSGRVFPREMKAAPLLRAWRARLGTSGVRFHMRHRWLGWDEAGALRFDTPAGERLERPAAAVLALGGASWPRLGSDGAWVKLLAARGIGIEALRPANCGFDVAWSAHFQERFAGAPVKAVAARAPAPGEGWLERRGEFVISASGVEGSLVYALSAPLRDRLAAGETAQLYLDLLPDRPLERVSAALAAPRARRSLSEHLRRTLGLRGVKSALLRELAPPAELVDPKRLAQWIKALPVPLQAPRPLEEAISSAGGVTFEALDQQLMLRSLPGVFCAGEMLDWEAPTGGYLLSACFATGRTAGYGAARWLAEQAA